MMLEVTCRWSKTKSCRQLCIPCMWCVINHCSELPDPHFMYWWQITSSTGVWSTRLAKTPRGGGITAWSYVTIMLIQLKFPHIKQICCVWQYLHGEIEKACSNGRTDTMGKGISNMTKNQWCFAHTCTKYRTILFKFRYLAWNTWHCTI